MSSKKPLKKKPQPRRPPKAKVDKFVEGAAAGKSGPDAVIDAGWNQTRKAARVTASRLLSNANIRERVERRKAEAMRRAQIHTDVIVGSLAEVATASLCDALDDDGDFSLEKARESGVDHLIKTLEKVVHTDKDGASTTRYKFQMYSRLDALNQLRDTFGMKQEARRNTFAEIEAAIQEFKTKAEGLGYELSDDEARAFIAPRLESRMVN